MNKLIVAALSIVGLVISSSVFAGEAYDQNVQPRVDEQKEILAQYKPPESFLKIEVAGEAPSGSGASSDASAGSSGFLGDDGGSSYDSDGDEDNTWQ